MKQAVTVKQHVAGANYIYILYLLIIILSVHLPLSFSKAVMVYTNILHTLGRQHVRDQTTWNLRHVFRL